MNDKSKRSYLEYLFIVAIIGGALLILKFLAYWNNGIFSWPVIIFPNLWVLFASLAWLKFKPLNNLQLSYQYSPIFLTGLSFLIGALLIIQLLFFPDNMPGYHSVNIYKFLFLAALVPISEELFYRGLFFHTLLRNSKSWHIAAIVVSATFALVHLSQGVFAVATLFIFSYILCYLACLTGNITSGVLVHIGWNSMYYNKLLLSMPQKWIFTIIIIIYISLITWKSQKPHTVSK